MTDSQLNTFEHIQQLCRDYRRRLKHAAPARIEDVLDGADDDCREMLFQNLLHIDIEFQRRQQQNPDSNAYIARFPQFASLIRNAFFESTLMSMSPEVVTPAFEKTHIFEPPAARKLGDYELLKELGRGSFGVVYEARHLQRNDVVALKTLPTSSTGSRDSLLDAEQLHRFKREFRSLADISHPNLVGLHSLEYEGDQWFFTMDVVRGTDFLGYVRPDGQLNVDRLRQAISQLVTGVMALHANYVIHRDLKPSNVMVDQSGRVVLLDFGLALDQHQESIAETAKGIAGTPAYMAPEQAMGESVTAASDWYAVGTMLYEALAGRLPFTGKILKLLQDKQNAAPPLPDDDQLPQELCQLCAALLAVKPDDRPDPGSIAQAVASSLPHQFDTSEHQPDQLVGRTAQLNELSVAFADFDRRGEPVAVFVDGRSGEGKTALCTTFLHRLEETYCCAVLSGRCYDRESVPFKALDTAIDAICGYLNGLPADVVAAVAPRDFQVLKHTFPAFGRVKGIKPSQPIDLSRIDDQEIRNRAFLALRELLGRISDRQPVVLFVDDLQWGDTDSAEVLLQALKGPNAPRVFFLGTYRTDEADDSRFLNAWHATADQRQIAIDTRSVSVGPLTREHCRDIMIEMLEDDTEIIHRRADDFFSQTGGNAFLFTELVGCFDPASDSFRQIPVHEVIQEKLSRLPDDGSLLLQLISTSGQAVSVDEISTAAGFDAVPTATLTRMRSARLIRFVGDASSLIVDTYHDRIRETVLTELPMEVTRRQHLLLGEAIERHHGGLNDEQISRVESGDFQSAAAIQLPRLFDLAFHFSAADKRQKAFAYSVLAAEQARRQASLEPAVEQYRTAAQFMEHASSQARFRVLLRLGESLQLLSRNAEAEDILAVAHPLASNDLDRCEVENSQAEVARQAGRYAESAARFAKTLRSLGISVPSSTPGMVWGILQQGLIQTVHSWRGYPRPGSPPPTARQAMINKLFGNFVMTVWFRSTPMTLWIDLAKLNHAETTAVSQELLRGRSQHTVICAVLNLHARRHRFIQLAMDGTPEDDYATRMLNAFYIEASHYIAGDYRKCQDFGQQGLSLMNRSGDVWRGLLVRLHILLADYRLGNLGEALSGSLSAFPDSIRLGDPNTAHDYINLIAMITGGNFRFQEMKAILQPIPDNYQATNQGLQAEARWHLYHDRVAEGFKKAEEAFQLMKRHVVINHITNTNFPLILEATRRYAAELQDRDPAAANKLLKQAFRRAKWAARITSGTADYPAVLRELGRLHHACGRPAKAIRVTQQSCRAAEKSEMKYELALSKLAVAEYRAECGKADAQDVEQARTRVQTFQDAVRCSSQRDTSD